MLAAYSALNFGHRHPRLIAAAMSQLERLTLVSRAFEHDQFGLFCAELAELAGMDVVLPMNTGAEAVETAIKVARKWGYRVKGVPAGQAVIIAFGGNFHGRTTTIVSFSTDPDARDDFGPYTPGLPGRAVRRPGRADRGRRRAGRAGGGRAGRADPGRGRGDRAAARVPGRAARAVHRPRHPDDRGRDPVRAGPHRVHVRLRGRRRGARRLPAGQGAGRRHRAGVGDGVQLAGAGRAAARAARLHVRREPAGLRGRPRGGGHAADR